MLLLCFNNFHFCCAAKKEGHTGLYSQCHKCKRVSKQVLNH